MTMPRDQQRSRAAVAEGRDPDDWYGVQDKRERKKIQDRLAQRSRRRRLAESKQAQQEKRQNTLDSPDMGELDAFFELDSDGLGNSQTYACSISDYPSQVLPTTGSAFSYMDTPAIYFPSTSASGALQQQQLQQAYPQNAFSKTKTDSPQPAFSVPSLIGVSVDPLADALYFDVPSISTFVALHSNAKILGLPDSSPRLVPRTWPLSSHSPVRSVPAALQPTPLQTTVEHLPYIDCIPFPMVRQNLLSLQGIVDEDRFCWDLVGSKTNFVVNNAASWDPRSWSLGPDFMEKWGFLFYQTLGAT